MIPTLEGGGAERQLSYLAPKLVENGWNVHIAVLRRGPNYDRIRKERVEIHEVSYRGHYDPMIVWELICLIRRLQPDIVQTWLTMMDILGGLAANICRVTWVLSERCGGKANSPNIKKYLRRFFGLRWADAVVANSQAGVDYWKSEIQRKNNVHLIRNGLAMIQIESVHPYPKQALGIKEYQRMVLFAGRMCEQKNVQEFLKSVSIAAQEHDVMAIICGDGPDIQKLRITAKCLGIQDRVQFKGYVNELWALMKAADVFVSVSLWEGMPNTVMEAMACGCPLIVSDIPEHREILRENHALFVNPYDPKDIANAINQVFENPEEASQRAFRAAHIAKEWTVEKMAEGYDCIYRELLGESSRR
ncbi:MAG: glycosyltransferase family 4 protein [Thermodesulfobacteriota bacterium]